MGLVACGARIFTTLMKLDDAQRAKVSGWIADGLKLSEIQNKITSELDLRMTYMEVRLLVDDLKLVPRDIERAPTPNPDLSKTPEPQAQTPATPPPTTAPAGTARVAVSVDQLARPGAVVSGKVTFTDGNEASWYFDQSGRLGLSPKVAGYRPSPEDLQQFQMSLESELSRMGF